MKVTPKQAARIRRTLAAYHEVLPTIPEVIAKKLERLGLPSHTAKQVAAEQVAKALTEIDELGALIQGNPE